ncbi:hypothetical protein MRX96_036380 [Rhipicephalus microplus]
MRGVHRTWASLATVMDLRESALSFLMMMPAFLKTASFLRRMRARLFWMMGSFNGRPCGNPGSLVSSAIANSSACVGDLHRMLPDVVSTPVSAAMTATAYVFGRWGYFATST